MTERWRLPQVSVCSTLGPVRPGAAAPVDRHGGDGQPWSGLGRRLAACLHLAVEPVGISFHQEAPGGVPAFDGPMSAPAPDGRRGRVAASCVFWVHGARRPFSTVAEDHGNCSVGMLTHGLAEPGELLGRGDLATLVGSGWVGEEALARLPRLRQRPAAVAYGPLGVGGLAPDVVLVRVNARQLMVLRDAVPDMSIEGKPQCHIVALAYEEGLVAASVGCALSRARTGMRPEEMTCALPGRRLAEVVAAVEEAARLDRQVAGYAAADARRGLPGAGGSAKGEADELL